MLGNENEKIRNIVQKPMSQNQNPNTHVESVEAKEQKW